MALVAGTRLGPYEILSPLGAGGMGEVHRARDTRLGRHVAVKVLPELFAADPERVARFQREAQLLASLNHPNVAIIHGLEDGPAAAFAPSELRRPGEAGPRARARVMELVEGPMLADRIAQGPLPLEEALPVARQIADALEAAHERGGVHRDLKPANIKVTPDGKVKVLDFGLAKLVEAGDASGGAALSMSPTLSVQATMAGTILGTAAYMSPEQARGKPVDRRTDIWAFGCVLFEMLTGKQAFDAGETVSDAVAAILKNEPNWSALPEDLPAHVRTLLRRCLQKDPHKRLPHIGVARLEIEEGFNSGPALRTSVQRRERLAWAAGLAFTALVAVGAIVWALRPTAPPQELRVEINTPPTNDPVSHAISPDGRRVVFVASEDGQSRLWLRSPGSRSLAFFANGALKRLGIGGALFRTSATGGEAVAALPAGGGHRFPQFLPGSRRFLFYYAF
jgi:serine/threonine-protein kinase